MKFTFVAAYKVFENGKHHFNGGLKNPERDVSRYTKLIKHQ